MEDDKSPSASESDSQERGSEQQEKDNRGSKHDLRKERLKKKLMKLKDSYENKGMDC